MKQKAQAADSNSFDFQSVSKRISHVPKSVLAVAAGTVVLLIVSLCVFATPQSPKDDIQFGALSGDWLITYCVPASAGSYSILSKPDEQKSSARLVQYGSSVFGMGKDSIAPFQLAGDVRGSNVILRKSYNNQKPILYTGVIDAHGHISGVWKVQQAVNNRFQHRIMEKSDKWEATCQKTITNDEARALANSMGRQLPQPKKPESSPLAVPVILLILVGGIGGSVFLFNRENQMQEALRRTS